MRKLLIAASLLCAGTVHGEPLSSMGVGTATCVQFATEYRADAGIEQRFFDWAQGLMSGINDALEDTMGKYRDLTSPEPNRSSRKCEVGASSAETRSPVTLLSCTIE